MAASRTVRRQRISTVWATGVLWVVCAGPALAEDSVLEPSASASLSPNQPIGLDATDASPHRKDTSLLIPRSRERADSGIGNAASRAGSAGEVSWYRSPWVSLALVLGSIGALAWILHRARPFRSQSRSALALLTKIALGPRQNLAVVRLGNRLVLVGATDHGISLISEVTDPEEIALIQSQWTAPVAGGRFNESLSEAGIKLKGPQSDPRSGRSALHPEPVQTPEAVQSLIDSLRSRRLSLGDKREQVS